MGEVEYEFGIIVYFLNNHAGIVVRYDYVFSFEINTEILRGEIT